jgi:predicted N-acetyltransferase YhbS
LPNLRSVIRRAREDDLPALERIVRVAFATHLGLPTPEAFGDRALVTPRWRADPASVLVAEIDGEPVGSNVATVWGTFGWFGPLTVLPAYWNRGVAQALLRPTMERFAAAGTRTEALFTFAASPKHVALYQRYDFWPRRLTAFMTRVPAPAPRSAAVRLSTLTGSERARALAGIACIADGLYRGLDVSREIDAVADQGIGETLVVRDEGTPTGFAICHRGLGSEAGSAACSVKFGAATSEAAFATLLDAVSDYAAAVGAERVVIGINTARERAYRAALAAGFSIFMLGVAMVRGGDAYDGSDALVIEDHR